jgi:hypothetical protein
MTVDSASRDDEGGGVGIRNGWYARIGTDWWSVILVGAITVLAVANVLPKIPW